MKLPVWESAGPSLRCCLLCIPGLVQLASLLSSHRPSTLCLAGSMLTGCLCIYYSSVLNTLYLEDSSSHCGYEWKRQLLQVTSKLSKVTALLRPHDLCTPLFHCWLTLITGWYDHFWFLIPCLFLPKNKIWINLALLLQEPEIRVWHQIFFFMLEYRTLWCLTKI